MKKFYILIVILLTQQGWVMAQSGSPFAGGDGTKDNPYVITTAEQLDAIRGAYLQNHFIQDGDISLDLFPYNTGSGWMPIGGGGSNDRFTGHYNGNGKKITGLRIYRAGIANVGLFGHVGLPNTDATTISNLTLENVHVRGGRGTGALVGRVTGNQNTRIENCHAWGGIVEGDGATGGLVGSNNSYMTNAAAAESFRPVINLSSAGVNVKLRYDEAPGRDKFGGLAGCNQKGLISNSFSNSTVEASNASRVGGFAGCVELRGIIINSYASGLVSTTNSTLVGGFLGMVGLGSNQGIAEGCYWDTESSQMEGSASGAGLTTTQMKTQAFFTGWDFENIWSIGDGYPQFNTSTASPDIWTWKTIGTNNWHSADNWDKDDAPHGNSIVVIPAGGVQPVISGHVKIRDLHMLNGAQITIQSGYILTVTGNLLSDTGNESISGEGSLLLSGDNLQLIPAMSIHSLKIDNLHNTRLEGDIFIQSNLEMVRGLLNLNGFTITLSEHGNLVETEVENSSTRIFGSSGVIKTVRHLNAPFGDIGGMGLEINSAANLGLTTIIRGHQELNGGDDSKSILRYFDIIPANNSGLNATLKFNYFTSELNMDPGDEENNFSLFKRESEISEWIWVESTIDPENNWLVAYNLSGFSTWTAGSSTNPLPISLLSFQAKVRGEEVRLNWSTASELNNDFFTLERSQDGLHFEVVGMVQGAGTTGREQRYTFTDNAPWAGISYYRLKQTDFDGQFEYFSPVAVNRVFASNTANAEVFPNPSNGQFTIYLEGESTLPYRIFDMQGRQVHASILSPMHHNQVDIRQMHRGIYTLVIDAEQPIVKKMQVY